MSLVSNFFSCLNSQSQRRASLQTLVQEITEEVAHIDFLYDEMREGQLCVDLSIEHYYKKIEAYPKPLKHLFDLGTDLLQRFE